MRYPEFLKENGTVGFVSPSFSCATEPYRTAFLNSVDYWKKKGHEVSPGENTYVNNGVGISNEPSLCARELTLSYVNPNVDAIISCGGGELMCETISEVDFDLIREAVPKWFMGYSDNTNFTFLLTTLCDTASIYGPCASEFGALKLHPSIEDAYNVLTGKELKVHNYDKWEKESLKDEEHPLVGYNCTEDTLLKGFVPSLSADKGYDETDKLKLKGRLIGGCLDCLANIVGTRFDNVGNFVQKYKDDGIVWYLEACDLNVFSIRRALWEMTEAGWFENASGFIIGRALNGEDMFNLDRFDAVLPYTALRCGVPVIIDADIGHLKPMMPVINGALSEACFSDGNLLIDMGKEM